MTDDKKPELPEEPSVEEILTRVSDLHREAMAEAKTLSAKYNHKIGIFILCDDANAGIVGIIGNIPERHVLNLLMRRETKRMIDSGGAEALAEILAALATAVPDTEDDDEPKH